MKSLKSSAPLLILAALSTACSGGGGGGGGATPTPAPAPAAPANPAPAGVLVADPGGPYSGDEGQTLTVDGRGSRSPGGTIVSYAWNFSDGQQATGPTPSVAFPDDGSFSVQLTVADDLGRSATTTTNILIANAAPSAEANGPYSGAPGVAVNLQGQGVDPGASDTLSFRWDFGDGSSAIGASVSHVYAQAGSFTATLTVTDDAGASASDSASVSITAPPAADAARIIFPTDGAPCESRSPALTITGAAESPDGVREIRVNGQTASLDTPGAQRVRWRARAQLQRGANAITVDMVTEAGDTRNGLASTTVHFEPGRGEFSDIVVDQGAGKAYIADAFFDSIVVLDLSSFQRSLVSSADRGAGPALDEPRGLALDAANGRLLVADQAQDAVLSVDLGSGDRAALSSSALGAGPALVRPRKIAIDAGAGLAYVTVDGAVLAIDLGTGDRSELSGPNVGAGPALQNPQGLALDAANNRAFVTDLAAQAVIQIDLVSGDRALVADAATGSGFALDSPGELALNAAGDLLYVTDTAGESIVSIRLATRVRQIVSGPIIGRSLLRIFTPTGLALDGAGKLYVTQAEAISPNFTVVSPQLLSIDLNSGERTGVTGLINDGPSLFFEAVGPNFDSAAVYDQVRERVYVVDNASLAVRSIDLATGNRSTISGDDRGAGPLIQLPTDLALDGNRLLVSDLAQNRILAIDLATGDRSELSGPNVGSGPVLDRPRTVTIDRARGRLISYASEPFVRSFIGVDLATGDRSLIRDTRGDPLELLVPATTFLDAPRDRLLILDRNRNSGGFITMDLTTLQLQNTPLITPQGGFPSTLVAMAPDLDNDRVFVYSDQSDAVLSFAPQVGLAEEASANGGFLNASGVFTRGGNELILSRDGGDRLLLLAVVLRADVPPNPISYTPGGFALASGCLIAVEPVSGDRVILSE